MATNEYGLDTEYFRKKLKGMLRDIDRYTPDEAFNDLSRWMMVAAEQAGHKVEMNVLHDWIPVPPYSEVKK